MSFRLGVEIMRESPGFSSYWSARLKEEGCKIDRLPFYGRGVTGFT